ncbi:Tat pathway signal protein [Streptomyces cuspidosporus]|uniref:Uncharacterized protein n=1 Tax=Streptomyces cuspidosporus TaxID=66882 RepID=A0ABP5THX4_9ACTN
MASRTNNPHLALWIAATGLSHCEIARRVAAEAVRRGHRQITPDAARVRRWIDGERPRTPVPSVLAAVLSETVDQPLTPGDLGLTAAGAVLDTIQVPLLTEAAAQTLAGWTQMDLFMDRRETLKLAVGAPLILAAERMLGGTARPLNRAHQGFGTDTVVALEEGRDAIGLLEVAAAKADRPAVKALVASQTGRVHAALGDEDEAEMHLSAADDLLADSLGEVPAWLAYFDAAEHTGARAVSARDLGVLGRPHRPASVYFQDALELRAPGFERVRVMDRAGRAAALFDEDEVEQAAAAAQQALDDAARVDSTLVASRLNSLLDATRRYRTTSVEEVRGRAKDLAAARPTTVAA